MSKVYVVQEPGDKNILPARDHGEIQILLTSKDIERGVDHCIHQLHSGLMEFDNSDSLLLIGDPIIIGIATHIATQYNEGHVSFLRWDRIHYKYTRESYSY